MVHVLGKWLATIVVDEHAHEVLPPLAVGVRITLLPDSTAGAANRMVIAPAVPTVTLVT